MHFVNTPEEDYHSHSSTYSDGYCNVDQLVEYAGNIGMTKLVITDHSDVVLSKQKIGRTAGRSIARRWENVHNDVAVTFGVEADLLNPDGDICDTIHGLRSDFTILSCHPIIYPTGQDPAEGFIKAIRRHHESIDVIGHVMLGLKKEQAGRVIAEANSYQVPLEINAQYFLRKPEDWRIVLDNADRLYVNSDAHTLNELRDKRQLAWAKIKEMGYSVPHGEPIVIAGSSAQSQRSAYGGIRKLL